MPRAHIVTLSCTRLITLYKRQLYYNSCAIIYITQAHTQTDTQTRTSMSQLSLNAIFVWPVYVGWYWELFSVVCLYVNSMSARLPLRSSVCRLIRRSIRPSVTHPSVYSSVHLHVRWSVRSSDRWYVCRSTHLSFCLPVRPSVCPAVILFVRLSVSSSASPPLCLSLRRSLDRMSVTLLMCGLFKNRHRC